MQTFLPSLSWLVLKLLPFVAGSAFSTAAPLQSDSAPWIKAPVPAGAWQMPFDVVITTDADGSPDGNSPITLAFKDRDDAQESGSSGSLAFG